MNIPFLLFWDKFLTLFYFGYGRKWGIVYDADSGEGIPRAIVRLMDAGTKNILEKVYTNGSGKYQFKVKSGSYILQAEKNNFSFPSKMVEVDYHGEPFEAKNDDIISVDIPIDPDIKKLSRKMLSFTNFGRFLDLIRIPVMFAGTILTIIFYIWYPHILYLIFLIFYLIMWALELERSNKPKAFGSVYDKLDKSPVNLTIVRAFNDKTKKLVSTKVTDKKGKYFHVLNPGSYEIQATKDEYEKTKLENIAIKKGKIESEDIYLRKLKTPAGAEPSGRSQNSNVPSTSLDNTRDKSLGTGKTEENINPPAGDISSSSSSSEKPESPSSEKPESPSSQKANREKLTANSQEPIAPEPVGEAPIVHGHSAPVVPVVPVVTEEPKPAKPVKPKKTKKLDITKKKKSSKK